MDQARPIPDAGRSDLPSQEQTPSLTPGRVVVPVVREELTVGKRAEERGSVVVHVQPAVRTEAVDVPLVEEWVEVERVPVNRFVAGPQPVRQEGDVTIVPVYEEVLVTERRLRLKEEVRLTRHRHTRSERHAVELRSEQVHVLRSGAPSDETTGT